MNPPPPKPSTLRHNPRRQTTCSSSMSSAWKSWPGTGSHAPRSPVRDGKPVPGKSGTGRSAPDSSLAPMAASRSAARPPACQCTRRAGSRD